MRKILSINIGSKKFADEYIAACSDLDLESTKIRARNCCIVLSDTVATLYHNGASVDLNEIDYGFIRVRGKFAHMASLVGRVLEAHNIPFNDRINLEHTLSEEKITQMVKLTLAGLPIPRTLIFTREGFSENATFIKQNISFPCVLKTDGSKGSAVWKIEDDEMLQQRIDEIDSQREVAMLQEFVPNSFDIRALYFYGQCLGAIRRSSSDGFYNNVSRGGSVEAIELTAEEREVAERACAALATDFGGVDIVRTPEGPYLFEVNMGPQIYGFENATGIDVPREIVKRIASKFLQ